MCASPFIEEHIKPLRTPNGEVSSQEADKFNRTTSHTPSPYRFVLATALFWCSVPLELLGLCLSQRKLAPSRHLALSRALWEVVQDKNGDVQRAAAAQLGGVETEYGLFSIVQYASKYYRCLVYVCFVT